jgi:hypothetical protein
MGSRPPLSRLEQHLSDPPERGLDRLARPVRARRDLLDVLHHVQQVLPGELAVRVVGGVPGRLDPEPPARQVGVLAEELADLRVPPDVERPLHPGRVRIVCLLGRHAVGVLGRVEPAPRVGHVSTHVLEGVLGNLGEEPVARRLRRLQVRQGQLGLVVQHLLEVRDPPLPIDRVAVEAAAEVIAHAAERHGPQRLGRHQERRLSVPPTGTSGAHAHAAGRAPRRDAETSAPRRSLRNACRSSSRTPRRRRRAPPARPRRRRQMSRRSR